MMPTFDFANVIRRVVRSALSVGFSSTGLLLTFCSAIAVGAAACYEFFGGWSIPSIQIGSFDWGANEEMVMFLVYLLALDDLIKVGNFIITIVNGLIPFFVSFAIVYFGAIWVHRALSAARGSIKDATA